MLLIKKPMEISLTMKRTIFWLFFILLLLIFLYLLSYPVDKNIVHEYKKSEKGTDLFNRTAQRA